MTALIAVVALFIAARYGWPWGVGIGLVAWLAHSYWFPWTACDWCKGRTKHDSRSVDAWAVWCWADLIGLGCGGTGKRRRLGSRLMGRGMGRI